jgi:hypothetical protein
MKLCKDCKHYEFKLGWIFRDENLCHAYDDVKTNLVNGQEEMHKVYMPCEIAREPYAACGHEGKLWEPK